MFKKPFSFKGKISGIELLISWIVGLTILISLSVYLINTSSEQSEWFCLTVGLITWGVSYILLSQTIKGCRLIDENMFSLKNKRIRRTEYGLSWIIIFVIFLIGTPLGGLGNKDIHIIMIKIQTLFLFISLIFLLKQSVKRCHDFNESGWLCIIPIYNPFWLLFAEGTKGKNRFGSDPKQVKDRSEIYK